eukprot:1500693-Rhodomonas_salina.1
MCCSDDNRCDAGWSVDGRSPWLQEQPGCTCSRTKIGQQSSAGPSSMPPALRCTSPGILPLNALTLGSQRRT